MFWFLFIGGIVVITLIAAAKGDTPSADQVPQQQPVLTDGAHTKRSGATDALIYGALAYAAVNAAGSSDDDELNNLAADQQSDLVAEYEGYAGHADSYDVHDDHSALYEGTDDGGDNYGGW